MSSKIEELDEIVKRHSRLGTDKVDLILELRALLAAPVVTHQPVECAFHRGEPCQCIPSQPATVSVDACDHCGKHTQGLDGETKWCTYCGGKL